MNRRKLLQQLIDYQPSGRVDQARLNQMTRFVSENARCFDREWPEGHVTGSAWLLNHTGDRVLLTHHRKLDIWCQLGGHCDGDPDTSKVAWREAIEESGIDAIQLLADRIFDLDIHPIPAHGDEPEHLHYDVRYLFQLTEPADPVVNEESNELRWVSHHEAQDMPLDESVRRMFSKWQHKTYKNWFK